MTDEKFIKRGQKYLTKEELELHLASLIRLENVGVMLGAGASVCAGGKLMKQVWNDFCSNYNNSHAWLIKNKFTPESESVNLEELLDSIEISEKEWTRQGWKRRCNKLIQTKADVYRAIIQAAILNETWWKNPSLVNLDDNKLSSHRTLLQALCGSRQVGQPSPWVFTTNYDLAIEWASESLGLKIINGFDGLHNRIFSPHIFDLGYSNLSVKGEARFGTYGIFLAKLHGSLSWKIVNEEYVEFAATAVWNDIDNFMKGEKNDKLPIVIPSAAKYLQTVGFVIGELLRKFTEFLSKSQSCLIISGYSFSDFHLNQIINRALLNPTLQIVIFLPEINFNAINQIENRYIKSLINLSSPQITIICGGEKAHFKSLVEYLPQAVIFDEHALKIKKMIKENKEISNKEQGGVYI